MAMFSKFYKGCFCDKSTSKRVGSIEEGKGNLPDKSKSSKSVVQRDEKFTQSSSIKSKSPLNQKKKSKSPPIPVAYFPIGSRLPVI
ncbi:hypothetical protein SAY86_012943 [Trapa natans]|uniref:Uncharacterized protein n=1 Tax=Trapa natans TaxID=22666 RepID=A0AAN7LYQ9_TRANT|nr:hypothetical protein SAY86_012943 [Trapa natans]